MSFVGDIIGGFVQDRAASRADKTMREASANEIAENRRQYDQTRADFQPWRTQGINALEQLAGDINKPVSAEEVMADPGYKFGLDEGQQAIDRKIAAMGGRVSGAAIKAAGRFGVNAATAGYGAAYQRKQDRLNRLASIAGLGQTATGQTAQAGQFATGNIGNSLARQGEASAGAQLYRGGVWANTANRVASGVTKNGMSYFGLGG